MANRNSRNIYKILEKSVDLWKQMDEIQKEWSKMIKGEPVNVRKVSSQIYESWQKSKEIGVDPFDSTLILASEYEAKYLFELNIKYGKALKKIFSIGKEYGYSVHLYDKNGKHYSILNSSISKSWLKEIGKMPDTNASEFNKRIAGRKRIFIENGGEKAGISAAGYALKNNKPAIFMGPQHYDRYLHILNCVAAPIHDINGEIVGALQIVTDFPKKPFESFLVVNMLSKLFDLYITVMAEQEIMGIDDTEFDNILTHIQQGIIYTDGRNCIKYYNERVKDIFQIHRGSGADEELSRCLKMLNCRKVIENKKTIVNIKGAQNPVVVSVKEINNGEKKNCLIILEEEKRAECSLKSIENHTEYLFDDIIGENIHIIKAKSLAANMAGNDKPVMIMGESGTGKELFAQAIHNASARMDKPFVAINCGAIPGELVESELFGYEPGSFTGALVRGKKGQIELASGGTLFLDEIDSMPLNIQVKLLRTLSTNKILKVGGTQEIPVDVRIISATKKELLREADSGRFREDLYYRISTLVISLPALRERRDDIPVLARYYIEKSRQEMGIDEIKVQDEFLEALKYYYWRGNVREFKNVIERSIILMGTQQELAIANLPEEIIKSYFYNGAKEKSTAYQYADSHSEGLLQLGEQMIIEMALKDTGGNIIKAANLLGVNRQTLYNKIKNNPRFQNVKNLN